MRWGALVVVSVVGAGSSGCGRIGFDGSSPDPVADCAAALPDEPCRLLVIASLPWNEARADCDARGMHLATIAGAADNANAQTFAARLPFDPTIPNTNQRQRMWIGGTDADDVGTWRWTTGEPFDYTNWRAGEPGSPGTEDCLIIVGGQDGIWDDRDCATGWDGYLCERDPS